MENAACAGTAPPDPTRPVTWSPHLRAFIVLDRHDPDAWEYASPADAIAGVSTLVDWQRRCAADFKRTAHHCLKGARRARISGNAILFEQYLADACAFTRRAAAIAEQARRNAQRLAALRLGAA